MSSDFDDRKWRELIGKIDGLGESYVKAGIVGGQADHVHSDTKLTNAEIGYINHFGTATIPARPFITQTLERRADELARLQARACEGLLAGRITLDGALALIGAWAAGAIKATIARDGDFVPNAPSTIQRKGSSRPLVDSGQLAGAVSYVAVRAAVRAAAQVQAKAA